MFEKNKFLIISLGLLIAAVALTSCSEYRTPNGYQTHPDGWMISSSDAFHGQGALSTHGQGCASCHGEDYQGGEEGQGCYDCHVYPHPSLAGSSASAHQALIASLDWDLSECSDCHGADYTGGRTGTNCKECHVGPNGPEGCTTCHWLPPVTDAGLPYGMNSGAAGAHSAHMSKGYACTECHPGVTGISHADALPAEVDFSEAQIANLESHEPIYLSSGPAENGNGSCGSLYCHSDTRGGSPNRAVSWHGDPMVCGDCHDIPPPAPPVMGPQCHVCHLNVNPASNYEYPDSIRFFQPELHVNGEINLGQ